MLLKYLVIISGVLAFLGCSTSPTVAKKNHSSFKSSDSTLITLSHVKAYLLIGNIKQAQKTFDTIDNPQAKPSALLTLAELRAASGNAEQAQQAFLQVVANDQLDKPSVSVTLIDYFCNQKKWPALQGYASALVASHPNHNTQNSSPSNIQLKNSALSKIGLCFFNEQHFDKAQKWLQQLDVTQQLEPQAYLALARMAVEQKQSPAAQALINQYETAKTKIDAKMLWTAFEVYWALEQSEMANQLGENLRSLFPGNQYTRKYILVSKRGERMQRHQPKPVAPILTTNPLSVKKQTTISADNKFHIIKKGETLYEISQRYGISILDLLKWNPTLVVDDIPLGASIHLSTN